MGWLYVQEISSRNLISFSPSTANMHIKRVYALLCVKTLNWKYPSPTSPNHMSSPSSLLGLKFNEIQNKRLAKQRVDMSLFKFVTYPPHDLLTIADGLSYCHPCWYEKQSDSSKVDTREIHPVWTNVLFAACTNSASQIWLTSLELHLLVLRCPPSEIDGAPTQFPVSLCINCTWFSCNRRNFHKWRVLSSLQASVWRIEPSLYPAYKQLKTLQIKLRA